MVINSTIIKKTTSSNLNSLFFLNARHNDVGNLDHGLEHAQTCGEI